MSTDRTFNPDRPDNIDATRRVDAGGYGATIRATSSTIRATSMGGTVRSNGMVAPQDENVDEKFFLLKGKKYKNIQSLSEDTGEAQVFLVERNGEKFVLKIYYPNFDVNKKVLQTVYNFDFEMIVKVYDFGKTYVDGKHRYYELMEYLQGGTMQEYRLNGDMDKFRRIALQGAAALAYCHRVIFYIRISNQVTSSSVIRSIQNSCLAILVSPVSWIRTAKHIRPPRLVPPSMRHRKCILM